MATLGHISSYQVLHRDKCHSFIRPFVKLRVLLMAPSFTPCFWVLLLHIKQLPHGKRNEFVAMWLFLSAERQICTLCHYADWLLPHLSPPQTQTSDRNVILPALECISVSPGSGEASAQVQLSAQ